ncbi:Vacuolar amino acid transporter 7 [Gurleya vavrai]
MKKSNSNTSGIFTLCKSILGASLITLPEIFAKLGIIFGTILNLFFMTVNVFSLRFITLSAKKTETGNLTELGGEVNRKYGEGTVTFLLFFTCIVPLIFYIETTTKYFYQICVFFDLNIKPGLVRIFTSLLCFLMCVIFRNIDKLKYVSIVGLFSLSFLTIYIAFLFIKNFSSFKFSSYKLFVVNFESLNAISSICFAFCSQFSILSITNGIEKMSDCSLIIWTSNLISAFVYILTGCLGYIVQPDTKENFLESMPQGRITTALSFALGIVNVSTFPLIMLPTRFSLNHFVIKVVRYKSNFLYNNIEAFAISLIVYGASILVSKNAAYLVNLFFLTGSLVMFAMPSYFYIKTHKKDRDLLSMIFVYISFTLTFFGLYMGIAGFYKCIKG